MEMGLYTAAKRSASARRASGVHRSTSSSRRRRSSPSVRGSTSSTACSTSANSRYASSRLSRRRTRGGFRPGGVRPDGFRSAGFRSAGFRSDGFRPKGPSTARSRTSTSDASVRRYVRPPATYENSRPSRSNDATTSRAGLMLVKAGFTDARSSFGLLMQPAYHGERRSTTPRRAAPHNSPVGGQAPHNSPRDSAAQLPGEQRCLVGRKLAPAAKFELAG